MKRYWEDGRMLKEISFNISDKVSPQFIKIFQNREDGSYSLSVVKSKEDVVCIPHHEEIRTVELDPAISTHLAAAAILQQIQRGELEEGDYATVVALNNIFEEIKEYTQ